MMVSVIKATHLILGDSMFTLTFPYMSSSFHMKHALHVTSVELMHLFAVTHVQQSGFSWVFQIVFIRVC